MIQNYIFDFGNVLTEFYPEKLTAPHVADEKTRKLVSDVAFDRLYWDALDWGTITDEEIRADIRLRLPGELGELGCTVYDNWVKNLTPVRDMPQVAVDLKKAGNKLYLLSNVSSGFANTYHEVPWIRELFAHFDGLVFSGSIGIAKPGKEIFKYVLDKFDLKAETCLFIDDNAKNIKAAEALGINGYLFDGSAEKLRAYLKL